MQLGDVMTFANVLTLFFSNRQKYRSDLSYSGTTYENVVNDRGYGSIS